MKAFIFTFAIILFPTIYCSASNSNPSTKPLETLKEKQGYALGLDTGRMLKKLSPDADLEKIILGLQDAFLGKSTLISPEEEIKIKRGIASEAHKKKEAIREGKNNDSFSLGDSFLKVNKKKEGIVTTPSGLQYKVLKKGHGKYPKQTDYVSVRFKGELIDGTEFINNLKEDKPPTFRVSKLIRGWQEALLTMREGARYKIFLPSRLAYEGHFIKPHIKPYMTLIFEIELLHIEDYLRQTIVDTGLRAPKTIPPYAFPGSTSSEKKANSNIDWSQVSLKSPEDAVTSVRALFIDIKPTTSEKDIYEICKKISTPVFMAKCTEKFSERAANLKQLKIIRANFVDAKRAKLKENDNSYQITWKESFSNRQKDEFNYDVTMQFTMQQNGPKWLIQSGTIQNIPSN